MLDDCIANPTERGTAGIGLLGDIQIIWVTRFGFSMLDDCIAFDN
jgi:hypothetical protein